MERYKLINTSKIDTLRMELINRKNEEETKTFDISEGDMVSILYIDKLSEIGEEKEYAIHGKINCIIMKSNPMCQVCKQYDIHYRIVVDASDSYTSKLVEINPHNILDIRPFKYEYDLVENPKLIPDPLKEGFFVHDKTSDKSYDISVPNDPLLGDKDFGEGGTTNE